MLSLDSFVQVDVWEGETTDLLVFDGMERANCYDVG